MIRNTNHEKARMANQGAGFNWGMSLGVIGGSPVFSLKG